jgi:hypothetical protein
MRNSRWDTKGLVLILSAIASAPIAVCLGVTSPVCIGLGVALLMLGALATVGRS